MDHFYFKEFCKPLSKEHSCRIIMLSNKWFGRRRFLKFFYYFGCHGNQNSSWNTIIWMNLKEGHLRSIPVKFGKDPVNNFWEVFLKKEFTDAGQDEWTDGWTDGQTDARRTQRHDNSSLPFGQKIKENLSRNVVPIFLWSPNNGGSIYFWWIISFDRCSCGSCSSHICPVSCSCLKKKIKYTFIHLISLNVDIYVTLYQTKC